MRHDPASAAVIVMLRGLKMYGMAGAASDLIEQGAPAFANAVPILSQLLKAEMAEREVRSIAYQMKAARFPAYKDLAGFDFAASEVNEAMVRQLHRCDFPTQCHAQRGRAVVMRWAATHALVLTPCSAEAFDDHASAAIKAMSISL